MSSSRLIIVHDVLGTLFGFTQPIAELSAIFADQLKQAPPMFAEMVIMDWYHATQRDFSILSINDSYQPIGNVFKTTLPRVLLQAGLRPPSQAGAGPALQSPGPSACDAPASVSPSHPFEQDVIDRIMGTLPHLQPRRGMVQAFSTTYRSKSLRPSGVTSVDLWGATNGSVPLSETFFKNALGQDCILREEKAYRDQPDEGGVGIFSCDEIKVAKPDQRVYEAVKRKVGYREGLDRLWFVASHSWDTFAAKKAGFKTAWVSHEEFVPVESLFGTPDVVGKDLDDIATKILRAEGGGK